MESKRDSLTSDYSSTGSSHKSKVALSEEYIDTYLTIPPDGGWGWIVVVTSFFCNFVVDGAIYTFGLFLNDISKAFNTLPTNIAIASSLMVGFYYLSGPVSCALVNRLGFQVTGVIGGIIAAGAFCFSTFTTSFYTFLIVFGVIGGCGFGLVYVPSIIVIGFYFERWRALATSLAVTGSAVGIIGFPFIIEGICVVVSAVALFYRPLKPTRVLTNKDKSIVQVLSIGDGSVYFQEVEDKGSERIGFFRSSASSIFMTSTAEGSTSTFLKSTASKTAETRSERLDKTSKLSTVLEVENARSRKCFYRLCCRFKCCRVCCDAEVPNRPMYRDDIFYGASLFTLSEYAQSKASHLSKAKSMDYTMSVTRVDLLKETRNEQVFCKCCPESIVRTLTTMMNLQLLKSPSFSVLILSGFLYILGLYSPFIYIIERADEVGVEKSQSTFFYTALGISNIFGRILSGIASTHPKAKPLEISYVTLFICGISSICSAFFKNLIAHFGYCIIFGLTMATFTCLRTPILVDLLGLENLTNAFGIVLLFNGIAGFLGVPLTGMIVTATATFNSSFIFAGSVLTLAGILLLFVKMLSQKEKKAAAK